LLLSEIGFVGSNWRESPFSTIELVYRNGSVLSFIVYRKRVSFLRSILSIVFRNWRNSLSALSSLPFSLFTQFSAWPFLSFATHSHTPLCTQITGVCVCRNLSKTTFSIACVIVYFSLLRLANFLSGQAEDFCFNSIYLHWMPLKLPHRFQLKFRRCDCTRHFCCFPFFLFACSAELKTRMENERRTAKEKRNQTTQRAGK